jgi:glucosyl-3-phosphoglycerate synthase
VYERENEMEAVMAFEEAMQEAAIAFYQDPMGVPPLSPWITVRSVLPEFSDKLAAYVKEDNA